MMSIEQHESKLKKINPVKLLRGSRKHFSENKYFEKLLKYARKIGIKISYYSLLLYYTFKSPATPKSAKLTIAGALGYLILPVDLIPDALPAVGFTDDAAVIISALYQVVSSIDSTMKLQAHNRMQKQIGRAHV